ncbi:alpha-amylase [Bifidobacterium cuniculi]|uniref:alpha-amylase n=1 Tax=Bifidobacterium cuniculi TaxID=1688 RepID=UPI0013629639|nr:alpha-amylase [Bifidobacterium cuniculi]
MHETLMQCFEWYLPDDGSTWNRLAGQASALAGAGITKAWLPPASKGAGGITDPGYGVYDLYDLGEFPSKGAVRTKYGTREEYLAAIRAMQAAGIEVLADVVLNHRMGGDERERARVRAVDPHDQHRNVSDPFDIETYTRFTFPARAGAYSDFIWDRHDFTGTSRKIGGERQVLLFDGKQWNPNVSDERGNFDYVLGIDVDFSSPRVREELTRWGQWFVETTGVDGFRLDAVKHIDSTFFAPWLAHMRTVGHHPRFAVGEYWGYDAPTLQRYLADVDHSMTVFDVPLHLRFRDASEQGGPVRHAHPAGRHPLGMRAGQRGRLRRQPRHPARPEPRIMGTAVVQAARLRLHPAARPSLPMRVPWRLVRHPPQRLRAPAMAADPDLDPRPPAGRLPHRLPDRRPARPVLAGARRPPHRGGHGQRLALHPSHP